MSYESIEFATGWDFESAKVNAEDPLLVEDVLLRGKVSANGYTFAEGCCEASVYNNVQVFLNHKASHGVEELAGWVVNPRLVDGLPRGDIRLLPNEAGKAFKLLVEHHPPRVGLSHVARYKFNPTRTVVESVEEVRSVDCVIGPATTKSFTENEGNSVMSAELKALYEEKEKELKEDIVALQASLTAAKESISTLTTERDKFKLECDNLQLKVDAFETKESLRQAKEEALQAIKDAGLDPEDAKSCSTVFVESVIAADEAKRKQLIEDRVALIKESNGQQRGSQGRKPSDTKFNAESAFENLKKGSN